ncbi:hypothetical protein [Pseudonocardia sp. WMMC193]|uniref:hypothetical protein n=1 Tax=Pseudonocardia sp. WMMC193 TaxID=2911965 RepID=UPI001F3160C1|nr:hypothetical protein [Pseudonocardia sp. WMMC193]MCF7551236.1 hypothetical protein [Pseudonocardia sp. WMMC193]
MSGVLEYVAIAVAPTLFLWAVVRCGPLLLDLPERLAARRRPPVPQHRPYERLVADLHRLRREVRCSAPTSRVRRVAVQAAYDDVLADLCRATGLEHVRLGDLPERERAFARLQAEAALEAAGVPVEEPPRAA